MFEHVAVDNVSGILAYPFSQTRRIEFSAGYTHYGYSIQTTTQGFDGSTTGLQNLGALKVADLGGEPLNG